MSAKIYWAITWSWNIWAFLPPLDQSTKTLLWLLEITWILRSVFISTSYLIRIEIVPQPSQRTSPELKTYLIANSFYRDFRYYYTWTDERHPKGIVKPQKGIHTEKAGAPTSLLIESVRLQVLPSQFSA